MSLRVWLPLNGTLDNQGLDNVIVTNNGATIDNNGKIGKCYSFDGSNDKIQISNAPTPVDISIAMWFKRNATTNTRQFLYTQWEGITLELDSANKITCSVYSNGSQGGYCKTDDAITVNSGWVHICFVFKNGVGTKLYINGLQISSASLSTSIAWGTTTGNIGYFSTYLNACINDFRIYDHALSAQEVKKIAQGLVLHFPLNRNGWGQNNLIVTANNTIKGYQVSNFTKTTNVSVPEWGCNDAERAVGSGGSNAIVALLSQGTSTANTSYSYSVYVKNNHATNFISFAANTGGWATRKSDGEIWLPPGESDQMIVENSVGNGTSFIQFNFRTKNTGDAFDFICWHYKIEIGEKTTRWCPPLDSSLYTQLGVNNNIEYDISGFKNNGEKTNGLTYTSNTPKYEVATHIGATSQKIHVNNFITSGFGNSYSFSWWGKRSSNSPMFWGFSNGIRLNGMYLGNLWNTGDSSNNPIYKIGTTTQVTVPSTNVWHHYVMTGNGTKCYVYLDGELWGEAKTYKAISGTSLYINGWDGNANYSHDNMDISDFRIYCTALSATDVKELYEYNKLG